MGEFSVGQPVRRVEDDRFVVGKGKYGDDVNIAGQAYAVFVRSPHAHATIRSIDTSAAQDAPGVVAVLTGKDYEKAGLGPMPCNAPIPGRDGKRAVIPKRTALAVDRVRHVGDPVAVVIAETVNAGKDAVDLVEVEYEPLEAVVETARAMDDGAAQIWEEAPKNIGVDWEMGNESAVRDAFSHADHISRVEIINQRLVASAMEPRMVIAEYDKEKDRYTVHTATQGAHRWRGLIAKPVFGVEESNFRVRTYDVGGSFGMKAFLYPEQVVATWAAKVVGRPVKWTGERWEAFLTDNQGRDHVTVAEAALDKDGKIIGVKCDVVANTGAYMSVFGPGVPTMAAGGLQIGVYDVPAFYLRVRTVFTNTTPVDAYRGAGRPEASYLIERLVEQAASDLGVKPDEFRARNFIRPEQMPHDTAGGFTFDSGDFNKVMEEAKRLAEWDGFEARRKERAAKGLLSGIGMAYYVERAGGPPVETAKVSVLADGTVLAFLGNQSNGMGHETVYAQVLADRLDIPFEKIKVTSGDTDVLPDGGLTGGSGSGLMGGGAVGVAAEDLISKGMQVTAEELEAAPQDIEYRSGEFRIAGTDRALSLWDVAERVAAREAEPGAILAGDGQYKNAATQFPNGCHISEVEIDPETGVVRLVNHTAVDDFGRVLNPLIVAGQVHGGTVQGLGQAMGEHAVYDPESGQLLTGSYMDYVIPRADDVPSFKVATVEVPCTTNELGVKGCGEAGATGAPTAFVNAVIDALRPLGIDHVDMPVTAAKLWTLINGGARKAAE